MSKHATYTAELLRALRISQEAYADTMLDEGTRYLELYVQHDAASRKVLMGMPEYWEWWNASADKRNKLFWLEHNLPSWAPYVGKWERSLLRKLFDELHAADMLASKTRPPRHVMRPAIAEMRAEVERRPKPRRK